MKDAADHFAKACRLDEETSCVMPADMYVEMVSDSPHGERVLGRAIELVRGPSDAGDLEACTVISLAMVSEQIPEAKRDFVCGRELARKAFLHAGRMEILPVDAAKARGYARRACEVLGKLRTDADCFVAREVEELLGEGAQRPAVEP